MITEVVLHAHQLVLAVGNPSPAPGLNLNPAPAAPPNLAGPIQTIIAWGKWLAIAMGVIGLIICGVMMMVGRRNRHSFAADGAAGIPWVLGGLVLVSIAAGIVGMFL